MLAMLVRLTGIQGNIIYNPIDMDKDRCRALEDCLQGRYGVLAVAKLVVPSGAPPEVPRLFLTSQEYNFNVHISNNMLQVNVALCEESESEYSKKLDEVANGLKVLLATLKELSANILYVGVVANYVVNMDEDGVKHILNKCFNVNNLQDQEHLFDIMGRLTYIEDETYYKNVTISNVRENLTSSNAVGIFYDVNDRFRYNACKNSCENPESTLDSIVIIHKRFISEKFSSLLD